MAHVVEISARAESRAVLPARTTPASWAFDLCILVSYCIILFFYGLGAGELYRTETLRAIIAEGFLRSGNWIVPTLYGQPLFTKPPGMYAAIALCSWPMGEVREWSARLPSALAATATVFSFYFFFRRLAGRQTGLAAAIMLPMSVMFLDKSTTAEIDMMQLAWVSGSMLALFRAVECAEEAEAKHVAPRGLFGWWILALGCVLGGFLTKWTAPAFFYLTAIAWLWSRARLRFLVQKPHLVAVGLAASVAIGWVVTACMLTGWDIFSETVSREALMRLSPRHHHRAYPWLESLRHPFVIFAGSLPWSLLGLLSLHPAFAQRLDERKRRVLSGLHAWLWPNLLFWSVIPEHAPRHSLPLIPVYAGFAALVWSVWIAGRFPARAGWWPTLPPIKFGGTLPGRILIAAVVVWIGVKIAYTQAVIPARLAGRDSQGKGQALAALVPTGTKLYLFRFKDEGMMFYYRRPVQRVSGPDALPAEPVNCILVWEEFARYGSTMDMISELVDGQGDPVYLMRTRKR